LHEAGVCVFTSRSGEAKLTHWRAAGAEILVGESIDELLSELGRRRFTNILVEGGSGLFGSLLDVRQVDEVHAFIAPKIFGGNGPGPVAGNGIDRIAEALQLREPSIRVLGSDVYVHGRLR
jgi:diaminohydroxyphosphoribosylaminopyrimidine deaminase / 5-amino-6-(5-phosphoribosylamino)uracil reductase